jgi:hypothetical protein
MCSRSCAPELDNVMALSGCNRIADITRAHVARAE